ncbi:MAG: ROK family protein, partial [Microbacterium gubbeenense]
DLSGSHEIRGAVLDLSGTVLHRSNVRRPADGDASETLAILERLIDDLRESATGRVLGVGVGTPGIVSDTGVVVASPDIGWHDLPLQENLRERTGLPVYVANDADVATLAERTLGGAGENFMLLKIDRGVGGGVVVRGELARGSRYAAGEVGHVTVGTDAGRLCACGRRGCLETWASVRTIETRISEGEPAERVLREAGERVSIAIAPVVGALDLSEVVLSGPVQHLDGLLRDTAERTLRERVFLHDDVQVRMSALGEDVVLLGATAMLLHGELGIT